MAEPGATNAGPRVREGRQAPVRARAQTRGLPLENPRVLASLVVLGATTLMAEVFLPAGVWTAVLHISVVFLGIWLARPRDVYIVAGVASALVVAGALVVLPPALMASAAELTRALASGPDLANRLMVLLAIWALAAVLARAIRREAALRSRLAQETARRQAKARELERRHGVPRPAALPERVFDDQDLGHEVRTMLNAIVGFSEAAKQEIFGPHADRRYRDYMGHINESGWALLRLFEQRLAAEPLAETRAETRSERRAEPGARRAQGEPEAPDDTPSGEGGRAASGRPKARAVNQ